MLIRKTQWALTWACRASSSSTASAASAPTADSTANAKPFEAIPSPKRWPLIGHAHLLRDPNFLNRSHRAHQRLKKEFGDMVRIDLPGSPTFVFMYNPDLAKDMYKNEGRYPYLPGFDPFAYYRKVHKGHLYPTTGGLVGEQSERWYDFRKRVQQDMLRPQSAFFYLDPLQDIAAELVDAIRAGRSKDSLEYAGVAGKKDTLLHLMHMWAFESICKIFLNTRVGAVPKPGKEQSKEAVEFIHAIDIFLSHSIKILFGPPTWKYIPKQLLPWFNEFDQMFEKLYTIARGHVDRAKEELDKDPSWKDKPENEMSVLEKLIAKNPEDESIPVIMGIDGIVAGIDTTGNTAGILLYQLASNPDKQEILHQELVQVFGKDGKNKKAKESDLSQLRYLRACLQESQRLMPVVIGTARLAQEDCVVGGYHIPKGTGLIQMGHLIGLQEENFQEAEKFLPERWLRGQKEHHPFASLPFGHGPRMCIGRRFATLEVSLLTMKVVQNFRMEFRHPPLDVITTFISAPDKPLDITFIDRD